MEGWAVITGAGTGIGRCLALELCKARIPVLGVARRLSTLEETAARIKAAGFEGFNFVSADVGSVYGRCKILDALGASTKVRYLVPLANAYPLKRFVDITSEEWRQTFAVNVEGQMFLAQILSDRLVRGARILFAKSGSSESPRIGCIQVCASMAASLMVQRCLKIELAGRGILVSSTKPGFVKTEMMDATLAASPDVFPDITAIRSSPMISAETCARYLAWLMMRTTDEEFVRDGWNIEDKSHHPQWLKDGRLHAA